MADTTLIIAGTAAAIAGLLGLHHLIMRRGTPDRDYAEFVAGLQRDGAGPAEIRAATTYRLQFARIRDIASREAKAKPEDAVEIVTAVWLREIGRLEKTDRATADVIRAKLPLVWFSDLVTPDVYEAWWSQRQGVNMRAAFGRLR